VTYRQKATLLAILVLIIITSISPFVLAVLLFVDMGISTNTWMVNVGLPYLGFGFMLATPILAAKINPLLASKDFLWIRKRWSEIGAIVLLPLGVITLNVLLSILLRQLGIRVSNPIWCFDKSVLLTSFTVLGLVLLGPIAEEVFWRGYIQDRLTKIFGPALALFIQAILFAFSHFRYTGGLVHVFVMGLIFGLWRDRKRSLVPIIIAHIIWNSLVCVGRWQDETELSNIRSTVDYVAELNRVSQPVEYDPNNNAASLYENACAMAVNRPTGIKDIELKTWPQDWSVEKRGAIAEWVAANAEALEFIQLGTKKAYYHKMYQGRDLMDLGQLDLVASRELCYAITSGALLAAFEGNCKQAFCDTLVGCRFGLHCRGTKPVIEQLVGMGFSGMSMQRTFVILWNAEPSSELLKYFQDELEAVYTTTDHSIEFFADRLLLYDAIQKVFTDDGQGGGYIPEAEIRRMQNPPKELAWLFADGGFDKWAGLERPQTKELVDDVFNYMSTAQDKTPYQYYREGVSIQDMLEEMAKDNAFVYTFLPDAGKLIELSNRLKSEMQALIMTSAILRYKIDQGSLPEILDDLVKSGCLDKLLIDPFSDKPLNYKRADRAFFLYSNGYDCDDDGGIHDKSWGNDGDGDYVFWPVALE